MYYYLQESTSLIKFPCFFFFSSLKHQQSKLKMTTRSLCPSVRFSLACVIWWITNDDNDKFGSVELLASLLVVFEEDFKAGWISVECNENLLVQKLVELTRRKMNTWELTISATVRKGVNRRKKKSLLGKRLEIL